MPLVSIAVSMTLGVALLRRFAAVQVVMAGFALVALALLWLMAAPGGTLAVLALAAALGLVQGASFAAVPELNADPADQARANGAMAQMGNVGNTIGTPALAAMLAGAGYAGMMGAAILVTLAGLATHLALARARARSPRRAPG
jgi:predicted MFS family arabinose efflux permease